MGHWVWYTAVYLGSMDNVSTCSALFQCSYKVYLHCLDEEHTRTSSTVNSAEENSHSTFDFYIYRW